VIVKRCIIFIAPSNLLSVLGTHKSTYYWISPAENFPLKLNSKRLKHIAYRGYHILFTQEERDTKLI
jgi:hypothetical protein